MRRAGFWASAEFLICFVPCSTCSFANNKNDDDDNYYSAYHDQLNVHFVTPDDNQYKRSFIVRSLFNFNYQ